MSDLTSSAGSAACTTPPQNSSCSSGVGVSVSDGALGGVLNTVTGLASGLLGGSAGAGAGGLLGSVPIVGGLVGGSGSTGIGGVLSGLPIVGGLVGGSGSTGIGGVLSGLPIIGDLVGGLNGGGTGTGTTGSIDNAITNLIQTYTSNINSLNSPLQAATTTLQQQLQLGNAGTAAALEAAILGVAAIIVAITYAVTIIGILWSLLSVYIQSIANTVASAFASASNAFNAIISIISTNSNQTNAFLFNYVTALIQNYSTLTQAFPPVSSLLGCGSAGSGTGSVYSVITNLIQGYINTINSLCGNLQTSITTLQLQSGNGLNIANIFGIASIIIAITSTVTIIGILWSLLPVNAQPTASIVGIVGTALILAFGLSNTLISNIVPYLNQYSTALSNYITTLTNNCTASIQVTFTTCGCSQ